MIHLSGGKQIKKTFKFCPNVKVAFDKFPFYLREILITGNLLVNVNVFFSMDHFSLLSVFNVLFSFYYRFNFWINSGTPVEINTNTSHEYLSNKMIEIS